jgi:hypothetical protein
LIVAFWFFVMWAPNPSGLELGWWVDMMLLECPFISQKSRFSCPIKIHFWPEAEGGFPGFLKEEESGFPLIRLWEDSPVGGFPAELRLREDSMLYWGRGRIPWWSEAAGGFNVELRLLEDSSLNWGFERFPSELRLWEMPCQTKVVGGFLEAAMVVGRFLQIWGCGKIPYWLTMDKNFWGTEAGK